VLHDAFGRDLPALRKEWGFAALVETGGQRILFDTGNGLRTFADNAQALGVDLHSLDFAIISHRHGDHTTGIAHLLSLCPKLPIYVPQETYGVFGSSLPGMFFPRCHSLPAYMRYYDGKPPEVIQHGTPWPDAHFIHVTEVVEAAPNIFIVPVVSDVPGTRELRELSLAVRNSEGVILLVGCSHPGIERILDACRAVSKATRAIVGGLHWVLTPEAEIRARAKALRDTWGVRHMAPGHCTGELAFAALRDVFQENYLFAGLGEVLSFVADA
jgi:7,8-dihydropterin-6-yl-methyl-4-(beta-D-ribofuranosyl)aminobenzene 5'-phosphate synthase